MKLEYTRAYEPLMTTSITLHVTDGAKRHTLSVMAHVVRGNPYASNVGGAYVAELYSVSFPIKAISGDVTLSRGGSIKVQDAFKTQLTIQNAYTLNGLYILECSAKERGGL